MRFAVALLCALALTSGAEAKQTPCSVYDRIPEQFRQTPTVEWYLYKLPVSEVYKICGAHVTACTYPCTDINGWALVVADDIYSEEETACMVQVQMAEMPPNRWNLPVGDTGTPLRHASPTADAPPGKPVRIIP